MDDEKEWLEHYKKVNRCRICNRLYGYDIKEDDGLCPRHSRQNHTQRRSWK